jgi:hypothetical protein
MDVGSELQHHALVPPVERVAYAVALLEAKDDRAGGVGEHILAVAMDHEQPAAWKNDLRHVIPLFVAGRGPRRAAPYVHDLDNRRVKDNRCVEMLHSTHSTART